MGFDKNLIICCVVYVLDIYIKISPYSVFDNNVLLLFEIFVIDAKNPQECGFFLCGCAFQAGFAVKSDYFHTLGIEL